MTDDELALRAALNVLRDSVETGRMPSGEALTPPALDLHRRAIEHLDSQLRALQAASTLIDKHRGPSP